MDVRSVGIAGIGTFVPKNVLTNADMEKMVDTNDEWIVTRTGIRERRKVDEGTTTSDLCMEAARRALANAKVKAEDLDLIIVATVTPDYSFPATACLVQARLGAVKAAAFDLSVGCAGFIYALATGSRFIASGMYDKVLIIGADTLSKITDFTDRSTCILFGDGAGAAVLTPAEAGKGILAFELGSQGDEEKLLVLPGGGSRFPASEETVRGRQHYIKMAGSEVFKFAVRIMAEASARCLDKAGLSASDVDILVPHQANLRIIESAMKRLDIDRDKVLVNVDRYGNMSAASIPVALDEALQAGKIKDGATLLMVGFGAGLTWGACALKWFPSKEES
ncbi:MAG TPA: beta-ketoacyl-ACP synthase III [Desulfobacteria bacterium]|nr:beta-ketoacyl-ACP synthase III [Desulfobacteria bacterium]